MTKYQRNIAKQFLSTVSKYENLAIYECEDYPYIKVYARYDDSVRLVLADYEGEMAIYVYSSYGQMLRRNIIAFGKDDIEELVRDFANMVNDFPMDKLLDDEVREMCGWDEDLSDEVIEEYIAEDYAEKTAAWNDERQKSFDDAKKALKIK